MKAKKLKRFNVSATVTGSKYLGKFQAATKEEAEELAMESDEAAIMLCHQCAGHCEDASVTEAFAEEIKSKPTPSRKKAP